MEQDNSREQLIRSESDKSKTIERYKKKLLFQVVAVFMICLVIILERVFYQVMVNVEEGTLATLQRSIGMSQKIDGRSEAKGITNGFLQLFDSVSYFPIEFLLLTHGLITLYVAVDALLATKVTYLSLALVYVVSVLQMLYAGPRPFWANNSILASRCLPSYNHPSTGIILMTFVPFYTLYCWLKNNMAINSIKLKIGAVVLIILTIVVQFLNYLTGIMYIINIVMSLVIGSLLFMVALSCNQLFDNELRKVTILKTESKKYVFYWMLFIFLLAIIGIIMLSGENMFLDIDWVENYMHCTRYLEYPVRNYRYDEIIGPWFNFTHFSILFAWFGALFGVSSCFRKMPYTKWAGGKTKGRVIRAVIANLLVIPSWIFIVFVQDRGTWVQDIGLNDFVVNGVHFFILYLWLFGFMPVLVLNKGLKITQNSPQDAFEIMEESMISR